MEGAADRDLGSVNDPAESSILCVLKLENVTVGDVTSQEAIRLIGANERDVKLKFGSAQECVTVRVNKGGVWSV